MKLTDSDLELLRVLYELDRPSTTRDVFDALSRERTISQNHVNTLISTMVRRGVLDVIEDRRPATYFPKKSIKSAYDTHLRKAARRLFGTKQSLVMRLLFGKQNSKDVHQAKAALDEIE